jgi:hypothetical protein
LISLLSTDSKPRQTGAGARLSVKADLEPFSAKTLDWFCCIKLIKALTHQKDIRREAYAFKTQFKR